MSHDLAAIAQFLAHFPLEAYFGFVPVLLFLAGLVYLDSFKLVGFGKIFGVLLLGGLAAGLSYVAAGPVMDVLHFNFADYSRYAAPVVEEAFKAAVMIWLFSTNRIGFMVDAAILGLTVGAGFACFENVYYAYIFPEANVGVWIVRGLGTAIMHGGVTAAFGLTAQALRERSGERGILMYLPGFLLAASVHSIFNQFIGWPVYSTAGTIVILPLMLLLLFDKSEHEVHNWLVQDYETHEHLLDDLQSGRFADSEAGRFVLSLSSRFDKQVVADIFAYIKLHTQLVLRAEAMLLARENSEKIAPSPDDAEKFKRLRELEKKIGRSAMLLIRPHLKFSHKELFELHQFEARAQSAA